MQLRSSSEMKLKHCGKRNKSINCQPKDAVDNTKQDGVVHRTPLESTKVYNGETGRVVQEKSKEHDRDVQLHHENINRDSGTEIKEVWMPKITNTH